MAFELPDLPYSHDALADLGMSEEANWHAAEFVRNKIREIVKDPETAKLLCPEGIIGCKRLCADTNYFETYNRDNVHLVDVSKQPIDRFTDRETPFTIEG